MPRQSRIDAPGALHHVIIRGIERKAIFKTDVDRDDFVDRFGTIAKEARMPCFAWALMTNHVHLLVRSGDTPLSNVMRRLLTGYAVGFNRRHRRHGHLFQNRYKSILCQEEPYFLELTRYIHLNPLRAGIVADLDELDAYRYSGHAAIVGNRGNDWQDINSILGRFGVRGKAARAGYRSFVEHGIPLGRRPEFTGGGLIRSAGGWKKARQKLKGRSSAKGDERILGDSDFVEQVLTDCEENMERRYRLRAKGIDLEWLCRRVAGMYDLEPKRLLERGRYPIVVEARSLLCFWAVRELGMTATELAKRMGMTQPGVSIAVKRGRQIAANKELTLGWD